MHPCEMTLLVAATTDVHGHLMGWDYYAARPDTARGLTRAATIIDSIRASASGTFVLVDAGDMLQGTPLTYVAARRRRFRGAPGVRRHERNALRRGGRRKPRVQLRAPLSLLVHEGCALSAPRRQRVRRERARPIPRSNPRRARRCSNRDHRCDDPGLQRVGPGQPVGQADDRPHHSRRSRAGRLRPPRARRRHCRRHAHRPRRALELRHRRIDGCRARTSRPRSRTRCRESISSCTGTRTSRWRTPSSRARC